jgi:hypothetical protein
LLAFKLSLAIVLTSVAIYSAQAENGMASFYGAGRTASGDATGHIQLQPYDVDRDLAPIAATTAIV